MMPCAQPRRRFALFLGFLLPLLAPSPLIAEVAVPWVALQAQGDPPLPDVVEVRSDSTRGAAGWTAELGVHQGRPAVPLVGCEEGATYVVSTPGRVSPPLRIPPGGCDAAAKPEVTLVPAAWVRGRLGAPRGDEPPRRGQIRLLACHGLLRDAAELRDAVETAGVPVVIQEDGSWSAPVPAGCRGIRLFTARHAPVTWARLSLPAGELVELPAVDLTAGAGLTAELSCSSGIDPDDARVDLVPAGAADRSAESGEPAEPFYAAFAGPRGQVFFPGLPAGSFVLRALPAGGLPQVSPAFGLAAGESTVQPVPCLAPARLTVRLTVLDPEVATPAGWEVTAHPLEGQGDGAERPMALGHDMSAHLPALEPGPWRLTAARDDDGVAFATALVELAPGADREVELRVESATYRGRVAYRGEPLQTHLRLRSADPLPGETEAVVSTDGEGRFEVRLPRPGLFSVQVQAEGLPPLVMIPEVSFDDPTDEVEVRVPATSVSGVVVTDDGRPAAGATVNAELADRESPYAWMPYFGTAGENGEFTLTALPPGAWHLTARQDGRYSRPVTVTVEKDTNEAVTLRLEEGRTVSGRLVSVLGDPVFPAEALVQVARLSSDEIDVRSFRTTPEGRFRIDFPAWTAPWLNVQLEGGTTPLTALRVPMAESVELPVPAFGGRVELWGEGEGWREKDLHRLALISGEGALLYPLGSETVRSTGSVLTTQPRWRLVLPNLAPGFWRVVYLSPDRRNALLGGTPGGLPPTLASFYVEVGEALRVEALPPA